MTSRRAYWSIPIRDNGDALVDIPLQDFMAASIHDYQRLGAPYGEHSPYAVRQMVLKGLYKAQATLQSQHPHWRLYIFDAYRPLAVQQFMANHAYDSLLNERHLEDHKLNPETQDALWQEVYKIWAPPNDNPLTPPPHSTGAAVDLTIFDLDTQTCIEMGSPIDEMSERSLPNYFADQVETASSETDTLVKLAAQNRQILADVMIQAGFQRHPGEWWHFCFGDQMWVWLSRPNHPTLHSAHYGRYDLVARSPTHG